MRGRSLVPLTFFAHTPVAELRELSFGFHFYFATDLAVGKFNCY